MTVKILQFGVNSNKATTGHKLQGVSLNRMVVRSWNHRTLHWIYVVLSTVKSMEGLLIHQKFNDTKEFVVDPKLIQEEDRLRTKEAELIDFWEATYNCNGH